MTSILGISAFYHDSAAALVVDGRIVASAQEERFSRKKNDERFPSEAIAYCLREAGLSVGDLDYVAFYDKPLAKFERLLETYIAFAPQGWASFRKAMPVWANDKLQLRRKIRKGLGEPTRARLVFLDHHESHAASAFFPSPFERAAIMTLDGVGEWSTATLGAGEGDRIALSHHLQFPHSLGLLYSAFTYYCGFAVNHGEYKLMGLAPYGRPIYTDAIYEHLVDLRPDGSFWLNMKYFNYCQGLTMTNGHFDDLFGGPARRGDTALEQRHMDVAASIQAVTEDIVLRIGRELHRRTGMTNLVMAGGVALNCVANGRLLREGPFESIWVQPAAGDAGGALGSALFVWHQLLENPRRIDARDSQAGSFLGPQYSAEEIQQFLDERGAVYRRRSEAELLDEVAQLLADGKVVGWFQGRMEFGPRALGARSILGDARSPETQVTMNRKIKFRESFRPFAPCVLREHAHEWFQMRPGEDWPYMLFVAPLCDNRKVEMSAEDAHRLQHDPDLLERVRVVRSQLPAVTHVDYSARVQTIDERQGRLHGLMKRFHERTGCPVLVNTSFNLSWEPIVMAPLDAYHTFMQSEMDALVLEDFVVLKDQQRTGMCAWVDSARRQPEAESPWADPVSGEVLQVSSSLATNPVTGRRYQVEEGIPRLFVPTDAGAHGRPNVGPAVPAAADVTDIVQSFYEKTPFPNYDDLDDRRALIEKGRASAFTRMLNEQIPYDARVVEVGCGTGQLTNFLSIANRSVLGVDVCLNSLRLAQRFKETQGLDNAAFGQMNLFRPALRDDFFDVVISNGVLHHTSDCRQAFHRIARLAKPGGYVVVGLYSAYSRRLHQARRLLYRWTGFTSPWLDPQLRRVSDRQRDAWFQDQYCHPHETLHSIGQVIRWMDQDGLEFVNSIPKPALDARGLPLEDLFAPTDRGTAMSRFLSQVADMGSGYREGGFFVVVGRRRKNGA